VTFLIRGVRQLLTLRGPKGPRRGGGLRDLGIIPDGALLVREGIVVEAGPVRRVENLSAARPAEAIEAGGRVVMPAFVDSHTHMVFASTALDDFEARLNGSTMDTGAVPREAVVRPIHTTARLAHRTALRLERMICYGSTTLGIKSGYGADGAGELKILRVARALGSSVADLVPSLLAGRATPPEYRNNAAAYIGHLCDDLLPSLVRRRLVRMADLICDPMRFTLSDMRRYVRAARALRLGVSLHAEKRAAAEAIRLGVEEGAWSVAHLCDCHESSIAALAASGVIATLLPGAAFHPGGSALPPARALIDGGAPVALASSFSPDLSPTFSMQMVISLACSQMRMTPAEAISAATINGAHALGLGSRTGSLEPGKTADLLLLNVSDYREMPFVFGVNHVHKVYRRGEAVYDEEKD
jgi:imidazolonepropionase